MVHVISIHSMFDSNIYYHRLYFIIYLLFQIQRMTGHSSVALIMLLNVFSETKPPDKIRGALFPGFPCEYRLTHD